MNDDLVTVRSQARDRDRRRRIRRAVRRWAGYMLYFATCWLATFALDVHVMRLPIRICLLIAAFDLTADRLPAWLREADRS